MDATRLIPAEERFAQWIVMGAFYGFPECCIKEFVTNCCEQTHKQYPEGPWIGTGFVPCLECAHHKAQDFDRFVLEHILVNRICPIPFSSNLTKAPPEQKANARDIENKFKRFCVSVFSGEFPPVNCSPNNLRQAFRKL